MAKIFRILTKKWSKFPLIRSWVSKVSLLSEVI